MLDVTHATPQAGNAGLLPRDCLRIVSWNIERGVQFSKIRDFLRSIQADLLLLQEVDLGTRRARNRDVATELAQALQLNCAFGIEFQELSQGTGPIPAYQGMATLSPWPLSEPRVIRFQRQSGFWKPRWYVPNLAVFQRRLGGRIALVAEATIHTRKVVTYNIHLESRGDDALRLQQLDEVLADCRTHVDKPGLVIAGDFNLDAGTGDAARLLAGAGFHDAVRVHGSPTTIPHGPSQEARAIDWIFVSDSVHSQGRVHNGIRASDHYPISATLGPI